MLGKNDSWGSGSTTRQFTYKDIEGKTFQEEMDGASVDMTVLYDENNTFYVNSTITTASGRTFEHNAQTTGADGSQFRLFLTVENASIEITTAEKVSRFPSTRAGLNNSWTKITDADDLKDKAQSGEYFFTIADATRDLMVSFYNNTLSYRQSVNPVEHLSRLFYIDHVKVNNDGNADVNGETEVYNLRNLDHSKWLIQNDDADFSITYKDQPITVKWTNIDIEFPHTNGVCTMAWTMHNSGKNKYFGAWDNFPDVNTMALDGTENMAGNKNGSDIGTFVIYAILREEFIRQYIGESTEKDITKFVMNPSFEARGWANRGDFLGWSQIEGNTISLEYQNNTALTRKDGDWYVQRWHVDGTYGIQQTINHLPTGVYKVTAATSYDGSSDIAKLFAGSSEKSFHGDDESYVISATTNNSLTFGAKITDVGNNRWFAVDNFRLAYVGKMSVGEATAERAKYFQPGQTVTIKYNDVQPSDKTLALAAETNVMLGDTKVDITLTDDAKGFTFSMPAGIQPSTDYTLTIPAGTIGNAEANAYNTEQSITLTTSNIFDGTYYLATTSYNGQKMFLSRGAHYGTEAVLDKYGLAVQVVTAADNTTIFKFIDNELFLFHDTNNTSIFADGGENTGKAWKTHKEEGGFRMDFDDGNTVRVDDGWFGNYLHTNSATSDHRVIWQTVTKEERDAIIAAYPTDNKTSVAAAAGIDDLEDYIDGKESVDFTSKILNNKSGEQGAWTWHGVDRNPEISTWTESNTCFEWYNGSGYATQTVTGLIPGVYKVTVDAIDRLGSVVQENKVRGLGYVENLSYLKANGEQVRIKNWYDMHEYYKDTKDAGYPYWRAGSAECMTDGHATVEVYTYVGEDGKLNLEINKPSFVSIGGHNEQSNFVFNNFTLTYYVNETIANSLTLVATAKDSDDKDWYYATFSNEKVTYFPATDVEVQTVKVGERTGVLNIATIGAINGGYYVPANTGVLIKASKTTVPYYTLTDETVEELDDNMLMPASKSMDEISDCLFYKLAYGDYTEKTGLGFWWGAAQGGKFSCKAGTAYLAVPTNLTGANPDSAVKGFILDGDMETAILKVDAEPRQATATIYDLCGRKVAKTQKGIYIVSGRKVLK